MREPSSIETQLRGAQDSLDRLLADFSLGIRSQAHYDELEERTQAIAKRLHNAFRRTGAFAEVRR